MNTSGKSLSVISRYRGPVFGISIIGIILFHFSNDIIMWRNHDIVFKAAKFYYTLFGSIGVEIFFFLSGVGLFFSMSKNPDVKSFYLRRLRRVLIPYLIWGVLYWFVRNILVTGRGWFHYFYDLSLLSFWGDGRRTFWFIAFIIAVYAAFPLLFLALNRKINGKEHPGAVCAFLCVGWISLCWLMSIVVPGFYQNIEVAFARVPIFVIGAWYGKRIRNNENFRTVDYILAASGWVLIVLHMISKYGLSPDKFSIHNRMLACFFSVSLLFLLCSLLELLNSAGVEKALSFVGAYSLELYITHVGIRALFMKFDIRTHRFSIFAAYLLLSAAFSFAIHKASNLAGKKLQSS